MGSYGFDDFKGYMKLRFGQMTELESVNSVNYYGMWLNAAYKDLTTKHRLWSLKLDFEFPELKTSDTSQSTADGTAYINVPSDCLVVYNVEDTTNDTILDWRSWNWYLDQTGRADTTKEGKPKFYTRYGSYIYQYPTPDAIYAETVWYRKRPAALTGTTATAIGEEWDEVILELACYKGFRWIHDYDKAAACKEEIQAMLQDRLGIYTQEKRGMRKKSIRVSPQFTESYKRRA